MTLFLTWPLGNRPKEWKSQFSNARTIEKKTKTNSHTCPIIWKVFIHDLSHLCLMGVKNGRFKVENDVEHGGLGRQGRAAVLRQRVRRDLQCGEDTQEMQPLVMIKLACTTYAT